MKRHRWRLLAVAAGMAAVMATSVVVVGVTNTGWGASAGMGRDAGTAQSAGPATDVGDPAGGGYRSGLVTVPALPSTELADAGAASVPQNSAAVPATALPSITVPTAAPWPQPPADTSVAVAAAVARAAKVGVDQSVVVLHRASGAVLAAREADRTVPALSLVKLFIAADVLDGRSPAGEMLPQIRQMIAASDDVIASALYAATGGDAMVLRVADRFGLASTSPTPDGRWWGNVQTTAADMASLLRQLLTDPVTSAVVGAAMRSMTPIAADGVDQRFGMGAVPGAGVKQGWGCCLSGVLGVHSMGFTSDRVVVVLSTATPRDDTLGSRDGLALQADAGGRLSIDTVTATVRAALGGPTAAAPPRSMTFSPAG